MLLTKEEEEGNYDLGGPEDAVRANVGAGMGSPPGPTPHGPRPKAQGPQVRAVMEPNTESANKGAAALSGLVCHRARREHSAPTQNAGRGDVAVFTEDSGQPAARLIPSRRASCGLPSSDGLESRLGRGCSNPTPPGTSSPPVAASRPQGPPRGAGPATAGHSESPL